MTRVTADRSFIRSPFQIFPGNSNTFSVSNNSLAPAIVASKIRLSPYSEHPRTVCLRVGLRGCLFNGKYSLFFPFSLIVQGDSSALRPGLGSTVCPILPGLIGLWQEWLRSWARWWNAQIKVNPTQVLGQMNHPVLNSVTLIVIVKTSRVSIDRPIGTTTSVESVRHFQRASCLTRRLKEWCVAPLWS